jgi:hypothetical protein
MKKESADYLQGIQDCQEGKPCPEGASKERERGYSTQFTLEANMTHNTEQQEASKAI